MTEAPRCKGTVWRPSGQVAGWGRHGPCYKKATKDGYCGTHHPDTVAKRKAATDARRESAYEESRAKWRREARDRAIVSAVLCLSPEERATLPESVRKVLHATD